MKSTNIIPFKSSQTLNLSDQWKKIEIHHELYKLMLFLLENMRVWQVDIIWYCPWKDKQLKIRLAVIKQYLRYCPSSFSFPGFEVGYKHRSYNCCLTTRISCNSYRHDCYIQLANCRGKWMKVYLLQTFDKIPRFFLGGWFFPDHPFMHHHLKIN